MACANTTDDLYSLSWSNPAWSHLLCSANVLDYFCDLSNPFYDRQCNNEVIRMQRLSPEQLLSMTGVEFYLHLAQEPILFVIRKQHRLSPTEVTPLAYYYVINGTVLQTPDLFTLLSSRLFTTVNNLNRVIQTLIPCVRYHPSDGSYSWDDPKTLLSTSTQDASAPSEDVSSTGAVNPVSEMEIGGDLTDVSLPNTCGSLRNPAPPPPTLFQVQRTDFLLAEWASRFPMPASVFSGVAGGSSQMSTPVTTATGTPQTFVKEEPSQALPSSRLPSKLPPPPPPPVSATNTAVPCSQSSQPPEKVVRVH